MNHLMIKHYLLRLNQKYIIFSTENIILRISNKFEIRDLPSILTLKLP